MVANLEVPHCGCSFCVTPTDRQGKSEDSQGNSQDNSQAQTTAAVQRQASPSSHEIVPYGYDAEIEESQKSMLEGLKEVAQSMGEEVIHVSILSLHCLCIVFLCLVGIFLYIVHNVFVIFVGVFIWRL